MPLNPNDLSIFVMKVAGIFLSFVGGIVTATWVVASKVKGLDDRINQVVSAHDNLQSGPLKDMKENFDKFDAKLDRLHERIDDILQNKN